MPSANYNCGSRDYLARARILLDENTQQALFYAAFELRCGIEARLQEYLEVQEHLSEKRKEGWRIAELSKNLKRAFDDGDKIVEIGITDNRSGRTATLYYTPVRASLKKNGQQLGNYLYPMKKHKSAGDVWWKHFRELLESTYQGLNLATTGTLLGPPLLSPDNKSKFNIELGHQKTFDDFMMNFGKAGGEFKMSVKYLENLPTVNN
jgi:hypothetical protein